MKLLPTLPKKPGHILLIAGEYPPMVGGVGAYTAELGAALVARGWQVSVLTSEEAQASPDEAPSAASTSITIYPIMQRWGWHLWPLAAQLAKKVGVDLIHVQYQSGSFGEHPAINVAPLWWRLRGIPVAWTFHDLQRPRIHRRLRRVEAWARDFSARISDRVISTNREHPEYLKQFTSQVAVIPIGSNIPARSFTAEARRARRALRGYGDDDLVVGYFGFMNETKGGLDLLKTIEQLGNEDDRTRLLMIGQAIRSSSGWETRYLEKFHAYLRDSGLADRIQFTGYEPDAAVSADLAACDLLVLLYQDGASTRRGTLLAGLVHGCAIVTTTPKSPFPEVVDGRDLLFVPIGDVEATVAAVRSIARDPAFKETLRQNALAASAAFTWEGIAAAHERIFLRP